MKDVKERKCGLGEGCLQLPSFEIALKSAPQVPGVRRAILREKGTADIGVAESGGVKREERREKRGERREERGEKREERGERRRKSSKDEDRDDRKEAGHGGNDMTVLDRIDITEIRRTSIERGVEAACHHIK